MPSTHTNQFISVDTFNLLMQINHNRYALTHLPACDFKPFYQEILTAMNTAADDKSWYLLGTDGCHLCDHAKALIKTAAQSYPLPTVIVLDLADAIDERLVDLLGKHIPILLTKQQMLCYPFGLMDITQLVMPTNQFA